MDRETMFTECKNKLWIAALLLVPAAATAAQQSDALSPAADTPSILGFGASLVLVIAAILIVGWIYAHMQDIRGGTSNVISILASQSLGTREKIVLVEVGDKQIVVGMTAGNLQTLHVFDEPVVSAAERPGNSAFAERLLAAIRGVAK